jgi:hypothetical protein
MGEGGEEGEEGSIGYRSILSDSLTAGFTLHPPLPCLHLHPLVAS